MRSPFRTLPTALARAALPFSVAFLAACAGTPETAEAPAEPMAVAEAPALCVPPAPTAAERIVRLHTRAMVAGLACGPVWGDGQAFGRYADFTVRNAGLLRESQSEVAKGLGGTRAFDVLHTEMSNDESMNMRRIGPGLYCQRMRDSFYAIVDASSDEIEKQAALTGASTSAAPTCGPDGAV
ncbi:hypothetical protein [Arenibaculum sp.]|uniref:hypothetical protein n=1 Tax=Arenibaculum sp. TaxID=2865862 RepID=UPI002E0DA78D|nr:hypothetical protein [Arenibaculum sp.]